VGVVFGDGVYGGDGCGLLIGLVDVWFGCFGLVGGFCLVGFWVWLFEVAESALAVVVVGFGKGIAVLLVAVAAGAFGAVGGFGLVGFEAVAVEGDFIGLRGEDDVADGVFAGGIEGSGLEVGGGGAVGVGDGVGLAVLKLALEQAEGDEVVVGLDGGAVLGEQEGDGDGVGAGDAGGELALASVMEAEEGVLDGGGSAGGVVGLDVSAERVHFAPFSNDRILIRLGLRCSAALRYCNEIGYTQT
jgi:hypothetical protein